MSLELVSSLASKTIKWPTRYENIVPNLVLTSTTPAVLRRLFYLTKNTSVKVLSNRMTLACQSHGTSYLIYIWLDAIPSAAAPQGGPVDTAGLLILNAVRPSGVGLVKMQESVLFEEDPPPEYVLQKETTSTMSIIYVVNNDATVTLYYKVLVEFTYVQKQYSDRRSEFAHLEHFEESHDFESDNSSP